MKIRPETVHVNTPLKLTLVAALAFAVTAIGCGASDAPQLSDTPHSSSAASAPSAAGASVVPGRADAPAASSATRLVAFLAMQDGYSPSDHDAYEARIGPAAASHGMLRDAAFTVTKSLAPDETVAVSSIGIWSLSSPKTLGGLMSDNRYKANIPLRNRIHDMPNLSMYMARQEFSGTEPPPGHAVLVAAIAMRPGYDFDDHEMYERDIKAVTERHGMVLYRSYRVTKHLGGPGSAAVVAINVWHLSSPAALGAVVRDSEYVANMPTRDRIHDMKATKMYFVRSRTH